MIKLLFVLTLVAASVGVAHAWIAQLPAGGAPAGNCHVVITGAVNVTGAVSCHQ